MDLIEKEKNISKISHSNKWVVQKEWKCFEDLNMYLKWCHKYLVIISGIYGYFSIWFWITTKLVKMILLYTGFANLLTFDSLSTD